MTNEARQRLLDALESCRAIRRYTDGVDFAAYLRNDMLRDAVERRFGIIGEALNRAQASDPALAGQIRELRRIVGLRNRVVHGYDTIDWTVRETASANLRRLVRRVLRRHGYPPKPPRTSSSNKPNSSPPPGPPDLIPPGHRQSWHTWQTSPPAKSPSPPPPEFAPFAPFALFPTSPQPREFPCPKQSSPQPANNHQVKAHGSQRIAHSPLTPAAAPRSATAPSPPP
jgi:uncharacterized protein with HEPN domain